MKLNIKSSAALLTGFLMLSQGCTDNFEDINTDPTTLTESNFDPNTLLPSVMLSYLGDASPNIFIASNFIQLMANCATSVDLKMTTGDKYMDNDGNNWMQGVFASGYGDHIKSLVELQALTRDKPEYANLHQIARLLKAMAFQRITDLYGDVPYFEAGLGYRDGTLYPKYDSQQDIYTDLLKEVEEAANALDPNGDQPTGDAIFNGDIIKWKRFGYSLLLRIAMRLVKVDEATAEANARKVIGQTMQSIDDNAFFYGSGADRTNTNNANSRLLLGDSGYNSWYMKWSATFINFLKDNNDPRLARIARTHVWIDQVGSSTQTGAANGDPAVQKGLPNGLNESTINNGFSLFYDPSWEGEIGKTTDLNTYSSQNPVMIDRHAPSFFLTYAETEFLLAEAAVRWGGDFGSPEAHYNQGVMAAMTYLKQYDESMEIPVAEAEAYLAAHPFEPSRALEMINTQYWAVIGTSMDFHEAWINWRRSGFPELTPVNYPGNSTGGTIPRRYTYPVDEAANNGENLAEAQSRLEGGDRWTSRVWWDK